MKLLNKIVAICLSGVIMLTTNLPVFAEEAVPQPRVVICSTCMEGHVFSKVIETSRYYTEKFRPCEDGHPRSFDRYAIQYYTVRYKCNNSNCGNEYWGESSSTNLWECWHGKL